MPYRTIISTRTRLAIWLVRYRQLKHDTIQLYLPAVSLSFWHALRHIVRKMTRIAVELSLLTFVRSSEMRFARWDEFDFDNACWRIPARREEIEGVRYPIVDEDERGTYCSIEHSGSSFAG